MKKLHTALLLGAVVSIGAFVGPVSTQAETTTAATTSAAAKNTATIEALLKRIAELRQLLAEAQGQLQDAIKSGLQEGMQDDDIKKVQELLASDRDIYPEARVTGYFGPMTKMAILRLQERYGLEKTGTLNEETRKLINELRKERQNGMVPPGLLRSEEVKKRVLERLQGKWGEKCDLSKPGRGHACEKPWKDDSNKEDDKEERDEEDDNGTATDEVTRDEAFDTIKEGDDLAEDLEDEIEEAEEDDLDAEVIEDVEEALDRAEADLAKARALVRAKDYPAAKAKAVAAIEDIEEAREDLVDAADDATVDRDEAEEALEDVEEALEDLEDAIDDAEDNGVADDVVAAAVVVLNEAEADLIVAQQHVEENEYSKAFELAEDMLEAIEEMIEDLEEAAEDDD